MRAVDTAVHHGVPGLAAQDGEPSSVELVHPFEELGERVDGAGRVACDGAQDVAREPEEKRGAQRCGGLNGWNLQDEREERVDGFEVGGECGERGRRVRAARK